MNLNLKLTLIVFISFTLFSKFFITRSFKNNIPVPFENYMMRKNSEFKYLFKDSLSEQNVIFEEDFEGVEPLKSAGKIQNSTDYGLTIVDTLSYTGKKSGRFELRYGDPKASNGSRSEIIIVKPISEKEKWYSFAVYFPSEDYKYDNSNESICQWHQGGSPALSLRIRKDQFYIRTLPTKANSNWKNINLTEVKKDQWHHFVFHVIHSQSDGFLEIWHNGIKILNYHGPINEDSKRLPNWKIGIYKSIWNRKPTDSQKRVIFFDNIKVGDKNANFDSMFDG